MKRVMRQVFGSTRPKDIWIDLWTFDRLNARALVHIVYWAGLSLLLLAAFAVAGVAIGNAISDGSMWGWMLALPMVVIGWLCIIIAIVLWRVACEFITAVMGIAEDLRVLRQYQERLAPLPAPAPATASVRDDNRAAPVAASAPVTAETEAGSSIIEDPFFRPRFENPEA